MVEYIYEYIRVDAYDMWWSFWAMLKWVN